MEMFSMGTLKLVLPTKDDKQKILAYKQEFLSNGETDITGSGRLMKAESFEDWYDAVQDNSNEKTVRQGIVPTTVYLALSVEDNRLVGMIDIRHYLNDYLLNFGGHIGYSVRASERHKGYATEMLALALKKCELMKMSKVLLVVDEGNRRSEKTILKNHAKLEDKRKDKSGIVTKRYWIQLS